MTPDSFAPVFRAAVVACTALVVVVVVVVATPALAQQPPAAPPATAPRPAYDNLRFREDWSAVQRGDAFDPLKRIALNDSGSVWLSLGGHVRARGESVQNFLGGGIGTRDDAFGLLRAHLHADLRVGPHARLFLETRQSVAVDRDLPGGARLIDRNTLDLGNAFAEVSGAVMGRQTSLRLGRQELALGRERIVSPLDWVNVRRVFHGAALESQRGPLTLGAFAMRPLTVIRTRADVADTRTAFWGSTVAWQRPKNPRVIEGALLVKEVNAVGATPRARRATATARVITPVGISGVLLEVEGGAQQVLTGSAVSYASMISSDLTWSRAGGWAPALSVGVDRSSGTGAGAGATAQSETWDQLYPLAHAFAGFADALGRRNLIEERVVLQASPRAAVRLRLAAHLFQRASVSDAVYDAAGAVLRASAAGASRAIGAEVDATAQWRIGRHVRLDGGAARFAPGQFMRDTGASSAYTWLYTSLTTTF